MWWKRRRAFWGSSLGEEVGEEVGEVEREVERKRGRG